ncbi:MAG: hypothetical protein K6B72_08095 [Lachnospiraceae bacterium]|nr:hypothetical protein [Lachnospiraceae bacterium]
MTELIICIVIAFIIALIAVGVMSHQMRPVAQKHEASQYTTSEDVKISVQEDRYLRTEVSTQKFEKQQNK